MGFNNFFLCAAFFLILHIFKNTHTSVFKCPPKDIRLFIPSAINGVAKCFSEFCSFICASPAGQWFVLEMSGLFGETEAE